MATENIGLPTELLGMGNNAEHAIIQAFAILDAEIQALKDRVTELEAPETP